MAGGESQSGGTDELGRLDEPHQPISPTTPQELSWRVRPGNDQPAKLTTVILASLLAFACGALVLHSLLLGIAGSVMILAATAEFWLGTAYRLDEEGASSRTGLSSTRILWKDVKRAVVTPIGIKLSPLDESTRLAPFRGVFIRFGREDRVRIEQAVRTLGGNDVRFLEGTAD